jgi:RNA polymerase sigma-70 factor (ECF subfamily)
MLEYKGYSDQELFALLKEGDQSAYTEIFRRYAPLMVSHAYRLLGDRDEANDVVQDVFLALWQRHASLELITSLSSYLYTAIRNRVFTRMSHEKVVSRYADSIVEHMGKAFTLSDDDFMARELQKLIDEEIAVLPEKMREVFLMYRKEELSYAEISERLGISDKTAKQQVYNATKILRSKLQVFLSVFFM